MTSIRNCSPFSSCARKINVENLSSKDTIILVMGSTGSGKDNFLRLATGLELVEGTRHDLYFSQHKFSAIRVSSPELSESDICFLDTPAFDRRMSDGEIAATISQWSNEIHTSGKDFKLEGLLYFHRISDTSTARAFLKIPQYFEHLIAANRIILATTMWDDVDEETGSRYEEQIRTDWKAGSSLKRFRYVRASVFEILAPIIQEVNTRNDGYLMKEITALGEKLKEDPSGRSLFPEMEQALPRLRTLVQSIRDQLVRPSLSHEKLQQLATEYQKMHVRAQRVVDGMRKIGFSMGEYLQMATRQLTWEPFIRETTPINAERHGSGLFREEGPWNGPGSGRDYDSWKEFEQWKEFEKWKEFKQWREYEQWMKFRQRRMHRHGTDEQQQVRVGSMATEEQVDTDGVAEARNEQGNREQRKPATSGSPSASLSTSKKGQNESQSTAALPKNSEALVAGKSTLASAALALGGGGINSAGGSPVPSKRSGRTTGGANESIATLGQSTNNAVVADRQQTARTMGGSAATELKPDSPSLSGNPNVSANSLYGSGRTASTGSAGRPASALSGGTTVTAAADKPKDGATAVPKGDHGKPSNAGMSTSSGGALRSDGRSATTTTATGGSSTTSVATGHSGTLAGAGARGQYPTTTTAEGQVAGVNFTTSASPPGTGERNKPMIASGGQPIALQSAGYSTNAGLSSGSPGSSPPSRGQSGGGRRPSISASGTAAGSMDTIWERAQTTAGSQGSGVGRSSAGVTVPQGGTPKISAEANRSAQDARGKSVGAEQGSWEQKQSLHSTSDSTSASSSNRNQNEGYSATGVTRSVVGRPSGSQDRTTNDGEVPVASKTSRRPSGGESESPAVITPSTSFGSRAPIRDRQPNAPKMTTGSVESLATKASMGNATPGGAVWSNQGRSAPTSGISVGSTVATLGQQEPTRPELALQAERETKERWAVRQQQQQLEADRERSKQQQPQGSGWSLPRPW